MSEPPVMAAELVMRAMRKEPADLELFRRCFADNESPKRPELIAWQYAQNPTGELFVDFALAPGGELAAIYATLPVRVRITGDVVLAIQSVDTITDRAHRGRGLFVKLANATYARAAAAGAKLVYGFPNGSSAHGFYERLGWTKLDPVPFLIRPLRTRYLAERLKLGGYAWLVPDLPLFVSLDRFTRRGRLERVMRFDDRATELWHAASREIQIGVERDARYLNWRLIDKPFEDYCTMAVIDDADRMTALVSHCVKDKHGGRIGYLMEALYRPGGRGAVRTLISRALGDMIRRGADVALAWCMPHSPTFGALVQSGFVPFPERYRPLELHAGARAFDPGLAGTIRDRERWYVSYLDSDTV